MPAWLSHGAHGSSSHGLHGLHGSRIVHEFDPASGRVRAAERDVLRRDRRSSSGRRPSIRRSRRGCSPTRIARAGGPRPTRSCCAGLRFAELAVDDRRARRRGVAAGRRAHRRDRSARRAGRAAVAAPVLDERAASPRSGSARAGDARRPERTDDAAPLSGGRLGDRVGEAAGAVRPGGIPAARARAGSRSSSSCSRPTAARCRRRAICAASGTRRIRRSARNCAAAIRAIPGPKIPGPRRPTARSQAPGSGLGSCHARGQVCECWSAGARSAMAPGTGVTFLDLTPECGHLQT